MKRITEKTLNDYVTQLEFNEKARATRTKYIHDVTEFIKWAGKALLDKALVLKYKEYLIEKYAPASVNSILSSLNSFFLHNNWYNLKVKAIKIQRNIFSAEDKELTRDEYIRLLASAKSKKNQRLYYVMQTICSTGIRVSELKYITVSSLYQGKAIINMKGKMRVVLIPQSLCTILKKYIKQRNITEGSVFVSRNGKPLDRSNIWSDMKALCKEANVRASKVFPHNLRHLFARTYYSIQKDVIRLADLLGHSSVDTTRLYTVETGIVHRKQIQELGLLLC